MAKKLYVGNIPYNSTEEQIKELFAKHGEVEAVNIITDRETGRSRGFCFVEMENADEAVTSLNGTNFGGRSLRINEARERSPRKGGRERQEFR
ncbi:MAG: RNA-binding protein [bacterium]